MARVEIKLDQKAVRTEILQNPDVAKHLRRIADQVAAAAGPGFVVEPEMGRNRARMKVVDPDPRSLFREAETGNLRRAVQGVRR